MFGPSNTMFIMIHGNNCTYHFLLVSLNINQEIRGTMK